MNQIIYILTNEAMPGYVKIWKTTTSLEQRIRELSASTSIPLPFTCFYACIVGDCDFVEKQLHNAFWDNRINPRREFLHVDDLAEAAPRLVGRAPGEGRHAGLTQRVQLVIVHLRAPPPDVASP